MRWFLILILLFPLLLFAQPLQNPEATLANEYFNEGEYEKSLQLYLKLQKTEAEADVYIYRTAECYLLLEKPNEALDFCNKLIKKKPDAPQYAALKGYVLEKTGKKEEGIAIWNELLQKKIKTAADAQTIAMFFEGQQKYEFAEKSYLTGRKILKDDFSFCQELASLYAGMRKFDRATEETVNLYLKTRMNLNLIKAQVLSFVSPDANDAIESALLPLASKYSNDIGIRELLYEFYIQAENFQEALTQAKSIDKMNKESGDRLYRLAQTFQNNKQFDLSNAALDYIIQNHKGSAWYLMAFNEKAVNYELKAFEQRPLDTLSLRQAVLNYEELIKNFGVREQFAEALYRKANLCVFYLNDLKQATEDLYKIEGMTMQELRKARPRLLLGDIFLMEGEYNKAKLKYAEVEERFKDEQISAMAKYRSARLSYFKGDFEMAKARLKTLKDNTSDDIANDAIQLFLLIVDNTGLDTNLVPMTTFAKAQLLIYQKNYAAALPLLDSLQYQFPSHALTDDILWEKANIWYQRGDIDKTLNLLDKILTTHGEDVCGDDAFFLKAEIYDYSIKSKEKALELYLQFLTKYPGSLYKVEVRKRIRKLRGETTGQ